jgi:SHS2 domain-containing protein
MKSKRYETLSHTADVMIRAFGDTLEECFENAGFAMFDQIADLSNVEPKEAVKFDVEGDEPEQLLVDFLSELLYLFDTEYLLLSEFHLTYNGEMLTVQAKGEKVDKKRHELRKNLKAVSYHSIEVSPDKGYAQVLFDA